MPNFLLQLPDMICENCLRQHTGTYGSGRFCTCKCARGFSTKSKRKEINSKVSKILSGQRSQFKGKQFVEREFRQCQCGFKLEIWFKSEIEQIEKQIEKSLPM